MKALAAENPAIRPRLTRWAPEVRALQQQLGSMEVRATMRPGDLRDTAKRVAKEKTEVAPLFGQGIRIFKWRR
ncbi:hypothetical protein AWV79_20185 [Cupriavidus sp. UYMMa02A]|nr:hypothetical protein AWV79_20185 [Cupriavidus sp. UYMMa02A]